MQTTILYPATAVKADMVRSNLSACGVQSARVRVMPNGALRVVLASKSDRDAARDAFVLSEACTGTGELFTSSNSRFAWNGDVEIFVRFATAS